MEELAAGAQWSAGSDGPKAKATVNDTRIAVRAAAMQSSDRRGVSVAQERPEQSEVPEGLTKRGNPHTRDEIRNRLLAALEESNKWGALMSRASNAAMPANGALMLGFERMDGCWLIADDCTESVNHFAAAAIGSVKNSHHRGTGNKRVPSSRAWIEGAIRVNVNRGSPYSAKGL